MAEAAKFGRAEEDGHVFLLLDGEEFPVGQYPGASKDEAPAEHSEKHQRTLEEIKAAIAPKRAPEAVTEHVMLAPALWEGHEEISVVVKSRATCIDPDAPVRSQPVDSY